MVATLPGRTQGLGFFTEPIRRSFDLDLETYGMIGLVATLLGSLFCLPFGWLTDRLGTRAVLVGVMVLLALSVFGMAAWTGGTVGLFLFVLLTRGFGQSALSVASLTLVGRSTRGRGGAAMAVYAFLSVVGFIGPFVALGVVRKSYPDEWRGPWAGIGVGVLAAAVLSAVLVRNRELDADGGIGTTTGERSRTLAQALRSGAFWVFALGTSLYGLLTSGASLFGESILAERGLTDGEYAIMPTVGLPFGLAANLLGGWLLQKVPVGRLFAAALAGLAVTLAVFPLVQAGWHAYTYAGGLAAFGGGITVCFFGVWRRLYGPAALGRIQGAAQFLTVLASGLSQALYPVVKTRTGEYTPLFVAGAVAALSLAVWSYFVRVSPPPSGADR
jgi:MFS family permease